MASKINDLSAVASALATDITNIVRSPFAPGDDHKITMLNLASSLMDLAGGAPANATYVTLSANATLTNERVLTGTANQVIITDNGANSTVVLSLPQSIAITSSPQFSSLTLTGDETLAGRFAGGSDGSLGNDKYFDYSQTTTNFAASNLWALMRTNYTLDPVVDLDGTSTIIEGEIFTTKSKVGNNKKFYRLQGVSFITQHQGTGAITMNLAALEANSDNGSTGSILNNYGLLLYATNSSNGSITNNYGALVTVGNVLAGGTITNQYGIAITGESNLGTITNSYGLWIDAIVGTNKWAIYTSTGLVQFGDKVGIGVLPTTELDLNGSFNERGIAAPAVSAAGQGKIYFDSTSKTFKVSQDGSAYVDLVVAGGEAPANATYVTLSANATLTNERVLTGTANQIIITDNGANSTVVLSTPQDIATASSPTFSSLTLNGTLKTNAINSLDNVATTITLQNQTFTSGATHSGVTISPTWTTENFIHRGLSVTPTQNGANTQILTGIQVAMTKATGATTLATMYGVNIASPTVTGTVSSSEAINIEDQTNANITNPRAININGSGVSNALVFGASAMAYSSASNNIRFVDSTNVGGLDFNLTTTYTTINSVSTGNAGITFFNQTFTPGANHNAFRILAAWSTENFSHTSFQIQAIQNGANTSSLIGIQVTCDKETPATTLADARGINVGGVSISGSITNVSGITVGDQSSAGVVTNGLGINILSQTGSATNSRAIALQGTGIANGIWFGASATMFGNAANNVRILDSTAVGGLDINVTTTSTTIRNVILASAGIIFQNSTTYTGSNPLVTIGGQFSAEDINHNYLTMAMIQNGANSGTLTGLSLSVTKLTAATTLGTAKAINISNVSVTGTLTTNIGIDIGNTSATGGTTAFGLRVTSQSANATTTRAIELAGTGVSNAIRFGSSPNIYSSGAEVLRMSDSTDARAIIYTLTAAGAQTISTSGGNLVLGANSGIVTITAAREEWAAGANVAAANDLTLGTDGNAFTITGNTQINALTTANWQSGSVIVLKFTGTPTIKHNTAGGAGTAPFLLSGGVDFVVAKNPTSIAFFYDGTNWVQLAPASANAA